MGRVGRGLGAVVCCYAVDYDEPDIVSGECDRQLVSQNVVLGFEVGGLEGEDLGE